MFTLHDVYKQMFTWHDVYKQMFTWHDVYKQMITDMMFTNKCLHDIMFTNRWLHDIYSSFISFTVTPNVTINCSSPLKMSEGEYLTCLCRDDRGNPPAKITWYKDGRQIGETGMVKKALTLRNVNREHIGKYVCVAQSHVNATDEKSIEVRLNCKYNSFLYLSYFNKGCPSKGVNCKLWALMGWWVIAYFQHQTRNYFFETGSRAHRKLKTANLLATKVISRV